MKKSAFLARILILALALSPLAAHAEEAALLLSFTGDVQVRQNKTDTWKKAEKGRSISEGGAIKTGANSRASVFFKNSSTVWLKPNTNLSLDTLQNRNSQLRLENGSVKIRVPHLKFREKFQLKTPTTIASVRGTVLVADANEKGELSNLDVLFGQVKLLLTDRNKDFDIAQGVAFTNGVLDLIDKNREQIGLEDWTPETSDSTRRYAAEQLYKNRQEIRHFVAMVTDLEDDIAATRDNIKDEDFAAGRTLVDVHGNIVRVDQRLDRPDNKTVQVLNVVKRIQYDSGGLRKWSYSGSNSSRIDALIAKVTFNEALPDKINEFPGFFSEREKSLKVDSAQLLMANMGDANSVFTIAYLGKRNPASGSDQITSDLYVGTLTGSGSTNARRQLFNVSPDNTAGLTKFVEVTDPSIATRKITSGDSATGELAFHEARLFGNTATAPTVKLWLASEQFIIDNSGKIRNVKDFTQGTANFQSLIKDTAGEIVVFAKQDSGGLPGTADATNFLGGNAAKKNIDLVFTPDLAFSIIKTLATSGDALKTTY